MPSVIHACYVYMQLRISTVENVLLCLGGNYIHIVKKFQTAYLAIKFQSNHASPSASQTKLKPLK